MRKRQRKAPVLQTSRSSDQRIVESTRQRVAKAKRARLLKWLLLLVMLGLVVYFGGPRLAAYMWGTP